MLRLAGWLVDTPDDTKTWHLALVDIPIRSIQDSYRGLSRGRSSAVTLVHPVLMYTYATEAPLGLTSVLVSWA